jgi:hypothetical protein
MPHLEVHAEGLEDLQERYAQALAHVYDGAALSYGGAIRPDECRQNVFDFESGLRLIVWRQHNGDGEPHTYFLAARPEGRHTDMAFLNGAVCAFYATSRSRPAVAVVTATPCGACFLVAEE